MGLTVAKFGGSSVRDLTAMRRCARIVIADPAVRVVVISATQNTTNELEKIAMAAKNGDQALCLDLIAKLQIRHLGMLNGLQNKKGLDHYLNDLFKELKERAFTIFDHKEISSELMDSIYAFGELISSAIFSRVLIEEKGEEMVALIDAREVVTTDEMWNLASPLVSEIKSRAEKHMAPWLKLGRTIVTQGFIGRTLDGRTTTLGREGSDYSATLLGEALGADLVQIWTDVAGISTCDPKQISDSEVIAHMSYREAGTMAQLGAKVLFPKTLLPAERAGMSVWVGSSLEPEKRGTLITADESPEVKVVGMAIQLRGGEAIVSLIGHDLSEIALELPEIDQGIIHRSFLVGPDRLSEICSLMHSKFLSK
jgi:aspartate kinase